MSELSNIEAALEQEHEWQRIDCSGHVSCRRCGWTTANPFARSMRNCPGEIVAPALDRDAMDDAARSPPAPVIGVDLASPDAADAVAYGLSRAWPKGPKATDASISTVAGKVGEIGMYRGMKIHEAISDRMLDEIKGIPYSGPSPTFTLKMLRDVKKLMDEACGVPEELLFVNPLGPAPWVQSKARPSGLSRELRERAERAVRRAPARSVSSAAPDDLVVTHLCDIVENQQRQIDRLKSQSAVAELDQENARLRRELAEVKRSAMTPGQSGQPPKPRYCAQCGRPWQGGHDCGTGSRPEVVRIEPLPDVKPYDDTWPPPSHTPRMLP